tara:strand:- start:7749 stop:9716 length:1968 start_codon:yes stop_codon:yes gene_type:complete
MNTVKKKKGTRVRKLANGGNGNGNGDPVKETTATPPQIIYADYDEDVIVPEGATVVRTNKPPEPGSFESVLNDPYLTQYGGSNYQSTPLVDLTLALGAYGLGSALPAIGEGLAASWRGLTGVGESVYSTLSGPFSTVFRSPLVNPVTGNPVAGGAITGEGLINSYFAAHGAMNLPGDIKAFIDDPSWEAAGDIGIDVLEMLPVAIDYFLPKFYSAVKNTVSAESKTATAETPVISLESSTTGARGTDAVLNALREQELKRIYTSHFADQVKGVKARGAAGILTEAEVEAEIATVLAYQNEYLSHPRFLQKLEEAQKIAELQTQVIPGTKILTPQANAAIAEFGGVSKFGFMGEVKVAEGVYEWQLIPFADAKTTAFKMVEEMQKGDDVLRNAIGRAKDEIFTTYIDPATGVLQKQEARGLYTAGGEAVQGEGMAFDAAEIAYLNTLSPEDLLKVLAHEDNHARLIPFLEFTLNTYNTRRFTYLDDIYIPPGGRAATDGSIKPGTELFKIFMNPRIGLSERNLTYLADEAELAARMGEIKINWWEQQMKAGEAGLSMDEWMYNWTPDMARKAYELWDPTGGHSLWLVIKGANEKEKFQNITNLLNNLLTPSVPIAVAGGIGVAATSTEAAIEEAPTSNKRGGFISKKKRRKGYRLI